MKIDAQDMELFLYFLHSKAAHTIWDVTKALSEPDTSRESLNKLHSKLAYRLNKLTAAGLFSLQQENGIKRYTANIESLLYFEDTFLLTDSKLLNKGKALILKLTKKRFLVQFL